MNNRHRLNQYAWAMLTSCLLLVSGCDVGQTVSGHSPVAAALPAPPMSTRAKGWVEQLHSTENGKTNIAYLGNQDILVFTRDVLTGSGTCYTSYSREGLVLRELIGQETPKERAYFLARDAGEKNKLIYIANEEQGNAIGILNNTPIRVVANSNNQAYTLERVAPYNDKTSIVGGLAKDPLIAPLWRAMQSSTQLTVAVDSSTAYTYAIDTLPDVVAASEYLCGPGASERVPSWSSIQVSSVEPTSNSSASSPKDFEKPLVAADYASPESEKMETSAGLLDTVPTCISEGDTANISGTVTSEDIILYGNIRTVHILNTRKPICVMAYMGGEGGEEATPISQFQLTHIGDLPEGARSGFNDVAFKKVEISGIMLTGNLSASYVVPNAIDVKSLFIK